MSWRDKVHAMRDGTNSEIVPAPVPPKLPKPGFVGSVSALPLHMPEKKEAANDSPTVQAAHPEPGADPDRWCYPHSTAMNTVEIDTFTARLARFTDKGLPLTHAEKLADRLVTRDRERDNRRLCLECAHLAWSGHCSNWRAAGAAIRVGNARVPVVLFDQLQHCAGFNDSIASATTSPLLRNERQQVRPDDQN